MFTCRTTSGEFFFKESSFSIFLFNLLHFLLNNFGIKGIDSFNSLLFGLSFWFHGFYWDLNLLECIYFKYVAFMDSLDMFVKTTFVVESFLAFLDWTLVFSTLTFWNMNLFMLGKVGFGDVAL